MRYQIVPSALLLILLLFAQACAQQLLPDPATDGDVSIEEALLNRRSTRAFTGSEPLSLSEVSQVLWAAQGITARDRLRTAPSAGALYPLQIYLVAERVDSLSPGIYLYLPGSDSIEHIAAGCFLDTLAEASLKQMWMRDAQAMVVITANFDIVTDVYGSRGIRYVYMEAGHVSQNIYLQCVPLGLGTTAVGAFNDEAVAAILQLPDGGVPLYLMPFGR
ncbi:MAG: SagB/ThcOx family dehydrogenase [Candidatus Sabulitectum sp.]|nr:SagB/ThcOx family dehydrogenase [Candidatus Sabulitectum sp.]